MNGEFLRVVLYDVGDSKACCELAAAQYEQGDFDLP
jgi:hypothetical protein